MEKKPIRFHGSFSSEISSLFPTFRLLYFGGSPSCFLTAIFLVHPQLLTQGEQVLEWERPHPPCIPNSSIISDSAAPILDQPAPGRPPDYLFLRWPRSTARVSAPNCACATLPDAQKDEFWTSAQGRAFLAGRPDWRRRHGSGRMTTSPLGDSKVRGAAGEHLVQQN